MTILFCPNNYGVYDNKIYLTFPNHMLTEYGGYYEEKQGAVIDLCIVSEIRSLWNLGITTYGSCCGHGRGTGMVNVDEKDVDRMVEMGYEYYDVEAGNYPHTFRLKSKHKDMHELL